MKIFKRNIIFILLIFISFNFALSKDEFDDYFQISANYSDGNLNLMWIMYDFEFDEVELFTRPGKPNNNKENLEDFKTKIDITDFITDSLYSTENGRKVNIYRATLDYTMKEFEEVILLKIETESDLEFISIPAVIKKNNGNNNPSIVFNNLPPDDQLIQKNSTFKYKFNAKLIGAEGKIFYEIFETQSSNNLDPLEFSKIDNETGEFEFEANYSGYYFFTIQEYIERQGYKITSIQSFYLEVDTCEFSSKVNITLINQDGQKVSNSNLFLISSEQNNNESKIYHSITDENGFSSINISIGNYLLLYYDEEAPGLEQFYNNAFRIEDASLIEIGDCGITKNIEFKIRTDIDSNSLYDLHFTKLPKKSKIKIGEEVEFEIEAKLKSNRDAEIHYSMISSDEDMFIDSESGEFEWTPTKSGIYTVTFIAEVLGDDYTYPIQYTHTFEVSNCEEESILLVTFIDNNGNVINDRFPGVARLFRLSEIDSINSQNNPYWNLKTEQVREVKNGFAKFEVDEGKYLLVVDNRNNYIWYENAKDVFDATEINLYCNETNSITMTLDLNQKVKETVRVSGYCLDSDGKVLKSKIFFEGGISNSNGLKEHFEISVENNDNGYYVVDLPKNYHFLAYAISESSNRPLYYDQTYNPFEAKYLITNREYSNINFIFNDAIDTSENIRKVNVSGEIVSNTNELIENIFIVALNVDEDTKPKTNTGISYLSLDGEFEIELVAGNYVFFAIPQSNNFMPGFYNQDGLSAMTWEDASVVNLNNVNSIELNIILQELIKKPGIARINGRINSNRTNQNIANANVMLVDNSTAVEYTVSNVNGEFEIPNIAEGVYSLIVNKLGYESYKSFINLNIEEPLNLEIELNSISNTNDVEVNNSSNLITIYPNPSTNYISIQNSSNFEFKDYEIIDINGKILSLGNNLIENKIDISSLPTGKYFIKCFNDNESIITNFTVSK